MSPYLPTLHNLAGVAGLALTLVLLLVLGALATGRRWPAAVQLLAGWGIVCLAFTAWAVATRASLLIPLAGMSAVALGGLILPQGRQRIGALGGVWRMLALTAPLWIVVSPLRPSQPDTWLNLLPNAAYLFDHGMVPADNGPPSYSFLPGAPYNTQFIAFVASVASRSFAEGVMGLFNIVLQCAAALLLAQVLAERDGEPAAVPPWSACAAGFLLAIPLNPGYVPRIFFSPYGEAPLAVATLFAVWLAARMLDDMARGIAWPRATTALALVLAALVNTKQSGPGLVASIGVTVLLLGLAHPRVPQLRAVAATIAAIVPAVALYLIWHAYVRAHLAAGELELLPVAAWHPDLLPQVLLAILHTMFEKFTLFICVAVMIGAAIRQLRRYPWSEAGLVLGLCAGVTLLFNVFLIFTYLAHFPPEWAVQAHSYFRYSSQLSLMVVLGLVVALRPWLAARLSALGARTRRRLAVSGVALVLVLPVACVGLLRFDLATPIPEVWAVAKRAGQFVPPGGKLAVLVPGDDGTVGPMLSGVLMFTPPRRSALDLRVETTAGADTLDRLAAAGYPLALISCTPNGLHDVPPNVAAMMAHDATGWHALAVWPYPPGMTSRRFSSLARAPACGGRS